MNQKEWLDHHAKMSDDPALYYVLQEQCYIYKEEIDNLSSIEKIINERQKLLKELRWALLNRFPTLDIMSRQKDEEHGG